MLTPVMALVALWIKWDERGPVLFRQRRVGQNGHLFSILKFRTMSVASPPGGSLITVGRDSRITRVGVFLRRYKLDEIPQLWNVFRGEMSLVGPRPEVPIYVNLYPDTVREKVLSVPPGITDFSALEFRDESTLLAGYEDPHQAYIDKIMPIKLAHYLRYIEERTLWLDIRLILRTLVAIVR